MKAKRPGRIVLVGFMGAGKSTVGPILAQSLGWRFIDSDEYLQTKSGSTIPKIFASLGELRFRQMEAEAIAELHVQSEVVLALGGGAIENEATRSLLHGAEDTLMIYLEASLDVLVGRCDKQSGSIDRPVLKQRDVLANRFAARLRHYEQAHLKIVTENIPPDSVAREIVSRLIMSGQIEDPNPLSKERVIAE